MGSTNNFIRFHKQILRFKRVNKVLLQICLPKFSTVWSLLISRYDRKKNRQVKIAYFRIDSKVTEVWNMCAALLGWKQTGSLFQGFFLFFGFFWNLYYIALREYRFTALSLLHATAVSILGISRELTAVLSHMVAFSTWYCWGLSSYWFLWLGLGILCCWFVFVFVFVLGRIYFIWEVKV